MKNQSAPNEVAAPYNPAATDRENYDHYKSYCLYHRLIPATFPEWLESSGMPHAVEIKNDFGTVLWTATHEAAFTLLAEAAWTLQMTTAEFVQILHDSDRECPKCKAGLH